VFIGTETTETIMTLTTSERIVIDEAAHKAAQAVVRDVIEDIKRIVENAMDKASHGDDRIVKLLETIADAQVHAIGNYASTLKSELQSIRNKNGNKTS
jgi:hypothetical protein